MNQQPNNRSNPSRQMPGLLNSQGPNVHGDESSPATPEDAFVYASLLGAFLNDQNPIEAIAGNLKKQMDVILNLNKNMKAAQAKTEQMQARIREVQGHMDSVNPSTSGQRLNRLR